MKTKVCRSFWLTLLSGCCLLGCAKNKDELYRRICNGDQAALDEYISRGYDVNEVRYGSTLLNKVLILNKVSMASILLDNSAKPNSTNFYSETPLMVAASFSRPELVQLLLKHGADVTMRDERGNNAVWFAVGGNPDNIFLLKVSGADINNVNNIGETPLLEAVANYENTQRGYVSILALLFLGAKVNCTNGAGVTPMKLVKGQSDTNLIYLFEKCP